MTRNLAVALPLSRKLGMLGGYGLHAMADECHKGLFMWKDPEFVMSAYWDVNFRVP